VFPIGSPAERETSHKTANKKNAASHIGIGITKNTNTLSLGNKTASNPASPNSAPDAPTA